MFAVRILLGGILDVGNIEIEAESYKGQSNEITRVVWRNLIWQAA